jgi:hypothetical protein
MSSLELIHSIFVAQPFDPVRFTIHVRDYLADTIRRRRDKTFTWMRGDVAIAEAESADRRRLRMFLLKPELKRPYLTAFLPLEAERFGRDDPADELVQVRAELEQVRVAAAFSSTTIVRLEEELAETRRFGLSVSAALRDRDQIEGELEHEIGLLNASIGVAHTKIEKLNRDLRAEEQRRVSAEKLASQVNQEAATLRLEIDRQDRIIAARVEDAAAARVARDEALARRDDALAELATMGELRKRIEEIDKINNTSYYSETLQFELD